MMHKGNWKFYLFCALAVAAGAGAACSRGGAGEAASQARKPAPPGGLPPLDEPGAPGGPGEQPGAGDRVHAPAMPPGHPPIGGSLGEGTGAGSELPGEPPRPGPVDPSKVLSGIIKLAPKVKDKVAPGDVLFLSVRKDDSGLPGPILAVNRMEAKEFPIPFSIDASKAMVAGTQFAGKVIITARVDKDGDAMTKNPGDVQGTAIAEIPQKHVVVTLDTVLQ